MRNRPAVMSYAATCRYSGVVPVTSMVERSMPLNETSSSLLIHAATASRVFKVPLEAVTPDQRRLAKVANFGSIYGQGQYGLSQQMGISGDEARGFLKEYWETYSALKLTLVGLFWNNVLPGSVTGDFVKMYYIGKLHPDKKAEAYTTVMIDRIVDTVRAAIDEVTSA